MWEGKKGETAWPVCSFFLLLLLPVLTSGAWFSLPGLHVSFPRRLQCLKTASGGGGVERARNVSRIECGVRFRGAWLLIVSLPLERGLAQLQQRDHLFLQWWRLKPAWGQEEKRLHKCLQSHSCLKRKTRWRYIRGRSNPNFTNVQRNKILSWIKNQPKPKCISENE